MPWRIEYTNHPPLKKKRRKELEKAISENIEGVKRLLKVEESGGLTLANASFSVESTWLPDLKKHHLAVRDLKADDKWVSSIVFEEYPTMGVEEVKSTLKALGFGEYSLYGLAVTNEQTVAEYISELEEKLNRPERDELAKELDHLLLEFLNEFLKQGIIKLSDGLLDAMRKIDRLSHAR